MKDKIVVLYAAQARKDLSKLEKRLAGKIVLKIGKLSESPDPLRQAKALGGVFAGLYRYRVGDYRAIFRIDDEGNVSVLTILHIDHRKDIYR